MFMDQEAVGLHTNVQVVKQKENHKPYNHKESLDG